MFPHLSLVDVKLPVQSNQERKEPQLSNMRPLTGKVTAFPHAKVLRKCLTYMQMGEGLKLHHVCLLCVMFIYVHV